MSRCSKCGGEMLGDGYTQVLHCEYADIEGKGFEPDAFRVECDFNDTPVTDKHKLTKDLFPVLVVSPLLVVLEYESHSVTHFVQDIQVRLPDGSKVAMGLLIQRYLSL